MSAKSARREDRSDRGAGDAPSTYREVTLSAVLFGLIVGAIMNASITYAGLKIGFTIVGSSIAAVLGFGVLRGILRRGTILETNIGQTIASAVNTPNAGVIFTVPVLFLLGYELSFKRAEFWLLTLACMVGAVLGCAFIIPLRKQMIDIDRLRFPSAVAVAAILKSPGAGPKKSLVLLAGIVVAMLIYLPVGLPQFEREVPVERLDELTDAGTISEADRALMLDIHDWTAKQQFPPELLDMGEQVQRAVDAGQISVAELNRAETLGRTAYRIKAGEESWSALREKFWVTLPMPGYSWLDWRMHDPREDVVAEAKQPMKLSRRVDRDDDGEPDLLLTDESIDVGRLIGLPDEIEFVFAIAPFALGAGYLTGRAGLLVLAGGILAFFVLNPVAYALEWMPATKLPYEAAAYGYEAFNRPLGIGLLLGGAVMGILVSLPAIGAALKQVRVSASKAGADELGLGALFAVVLVSVVLLFVAAQQMSSIKSSEEPVAPAAEDGAPGGIAVAGASGIAEVEAPDHSPVVDRGLLGGMSPMVRNAILAVLGAVWIWFVGIIIAQCTGMTDWSPISGLALITVVLVMLLVGTSAILTAVLFGAAVCVALSCAADMMQDLKTGYLVGAIPRRQQALELATAGIGPLISMATLMLIVQGNLKTEGVPIGPPTDTIAPQAQALEAVVTGVQGGEMPYALYGAGTALGMLLGMGTFSGLGVLVGLSMYLPIKFILTYGVGCVVNIAATRLYGRELAEEWGVPFCAGLIVGEAILGLGINALVLSPLI